MATAAFAKPHGAVLAVAQVASIWWRSDFRGAVSYACKVAGAVGLWLGVCVTLSHQPLSWWQHMVVIPSKLPWAPDPLAQLARVPGWMTGAVILPALVSVFVLGRGRRKPEALAAFSFLFVLPFSLAAFLKTEGNTNSLHPAFYLFA